MSGTRSAAASASEKEPPAMVSKRYKERGKNKLQLVFLRLMERQRKIIQPRMFIALRSIIAHPDPVINARQKKFSLNYVN